VTMEAFIAVLLIVGLLVLFLGLRLRAKPENRSITSYLGVPHPESGNAKESAATLLVMVLQILGVIVIVIAVISFFYLIDILNERGMFSSDDQVTLGSIVFSFVVAFYQVVIGVLCIAVAQLLQVVKPSPQEQGQASP